MKTLKYAALTLALAMNLSPLAARDGKHEYSLNFTGGMTVPLSAPRGGMDGDDFNVKFGASYAHNFTGRIAVVTGLEYANYSGSISYSLLRDSYTEIDHRVNPSSQARYEYSISKYREQPTISLLSVPVMFRYTTELNDYSKLYFAGGCKIAFPVSTRTKISGKLASWAHFDHENVDYSDLPEHNMYNGFEIGARTSGIDVKPAALLSLESGLRFSIGRVFVYTALNLDCSLNDLKRTNGKHSVSFGSSGMKNESLLNTSFTGKLKIYSLGLKIGLGILR